MKQVIFISQIVIASFLIALILIQTKGTGLSSAWGGGEFYRSKRGVEKILFIATIVMAALFLLFSMANIFFS